MDCKPKAVITCNAVKRGPKVLNLKEIVDVGLTECAKNGISVGGYIEVIAFLFKLDLTSTVIPLTCIYELKLLASFGLKFV